MCELVMFGVVISLMAKVADHDGKSPWAWAGVTLLICFLMFLLPLPFLRVIIALVVAFVVMMLYNTITND